MCRVTQNRTFRYFLVSFLGRLYVLYGGALAEQETAFGLFLANSLSKFECTEVPRPTRKTPISSAEKKTMDMHEYGKIWPAN